MASIGCDTLPLAHRLVMSLPGTLPGVTFHSLDFCHWLAMSELQGHNATDPDSLLPVGYLVAINKALDELAMDFPWEVVHHHGDIEPAISDILEILGEKTGFAPVDDPVIFWGVAQVGPRITFTYCRRDQVPPRFLPSA